VPTPVTFADFDLPENIVRYLADSGITIPTPIQAAALGDLLAGRDVVGGAPTGSGKTLAFGLPLLTSIGSARPHHPRAIVLAPTRELAGQIQQVLEPLGRLTRHSVASVYGGVGFGQQIKALRNGVDVLVACPGRLEDLIQQGYVRLTEVEVMIVDEADRMVDVGFMPAVNRLLDATPGRRQTVLFSATLDKQVDKVIANHLPSASRHRIVADEVELSRATHLFWSTRPEERVTLTAEIVRRSGRTIIFTRTKRGADRVAKQLEALGVNAAAIHGDRSQAQRERALEKFRAGRVTALVATDVAARGIHVDAVGSVVHFDPPEVAADYQHRSGRTARAGASGIVTTFVVSDKRRAVRGLQRELGRTEPVTAPDIALIPELPPVEVLPERATLAPQPAAKPKRFEQRSSNGRSYGGARKGGPRRDHKAGGYRHNDRSRSHGAGDRQGGGAGQTRSRTGGSRTGG
jgi:superfamily II DNA/RNA helicase